MTTTITLKKSKGDNTELEIDLDEFPTVDLIRLKIAETVGEDSAHIQLIHKGKILKDDQKTKQLKLTDTQTFFLAVKSPQQPKAAPEKKPVMVQPHPCENYHGPPRMPQKKPPEEKSPKKKQGKKQSKGHAAGPRNSYRCQGPGNPEQLKKFIQAFTAMIQYIRKSDLQRLLQFIQSNPVLKRQFQSQPALKALKESGNVDHLKGLLIEILQSQVNFTLSKLGAPSQKTGSESVDLGSARDLQAVETESEGKCSMEKKSLCIKQQEQDDVLTKLQQLNQLGFVEHDRNEKLLSEHDGDLEKVMQILQNQKDSS